MTYTRAPGTSAPKRCPKCTRVDPPCGFGLNRYRKDGLAELCADCRLEKSRSDEVKRKARKSHEATDVERYRSPPSERAGRFPCAAVGCEMSFSSAEILECHRAMRGHG